MASGMYYIPRCGLLVPQAAVLSVQIERATRTEYEIEGNIDARMVDPLVYTLSGHTNRFTITLDASFVPHMVEEGSEDTFIQVQIETEVNLLRSAEGIPMSSHPIFVDAVRVLEEEVPTSRRERDAYEQRAERGQKFVNNFRHMAQAAQQYHSVISTIADQTGTGSPADDLLPASLQAKVAGVVSQSLESHAAVLRRQADTYRTKYTTLIGWFGRNLFKHTDGDYVPAELNYEDLSTMIEGFIGTHLIEVNFS